MLKFTPILLALIYAVVIYRMSVWRMARELDHKSRPLAEPALAPVMDRLARALNLKAIQVHLYDVPMVNGLAAPDGRIFLTRGFLDRFRAGEVTADELASVVAHELGHVALGHTRRRMIDFGGQNAVRTALALFLSRFLPGIGPMIANLLTGLVAARLSRDDEYAADRYATALLIKAGIGPAPQVSLFRKLSAMTGGAAGAMPAWFLSHPRAEDRIAAVETNAARWQGGPPDPRRN